MSNPDRTVTYVALILGLFLIGIGAYLSTYTTVGFVNTTVNYGLGNITIPLATKIQTYLGIGIVVILLGVAFIGVALHEAQKKSAIIQEQQAKAPAQSVPSNQCRFCGTLNEKDRLFCEQCGRVLSE